MKSLVLLLSMAFFAGSGVFGSAIANRLGMVDVVQYKINPSQPNCENCVESGGIPETSCTTEPSEDLCTCTIGETELLGFNQNCQQLYRAD